MFKTANSAYQEISCSAETIQMEETKTSKKPSVINKNDVKQDDLITQEQDNIMQLEYDWNALYNINSDIIGWLYFPNSSINYPVVKASDNQFYLSHDFTKEKNKLGCLFMDKNANDDDFNRVIYGHNIKSDTEIMFSSLLSYETENYFNNNGYFYFSDPTIGTTVYEIIAVVKYNIKDAVEWDFRTKNQETIKDIQKFMDQIRARSHIYKNTNKLPRNIMILSTCDRREHGKNGRFLVIGACF